MPTREIARSEWKTYFDEFSRSRSGERVTVELIFDPQDDPKFSLEKQPLVGISFEEKGSDEGAFLIMAGGERTDSMTHAITHPVHVYHKNARGLLSDEVNVDEVLEITSTDDPRITYLRFEPVGEA